MSFTQRWNLRSRICRGFALAHRTAIGAAVVAVLLTLSSVRLAGCGDEGIQLPVSTGELRILCSAVPVGFDSASVTISQISAVVDGSTISMLSAPVTVRLSDLAGTETMLVVRAAIPLGEYTKVTVAFSDVALVHDSARIPVALSSSARSGAQYVQRFTVHSDTTMALILEVNLSRSLYAARVALEDRDSVFYQFSPVIRIAEMQLCGHVRGRIANPEHHPDLFFVAGRDTISVTPVSMPDGGFFQAWLPEQRYEIVARDTLGRTAGIDSALVRRDETTDIGILTLRPL